MSTYTESWLQGPQSTKFYTRAYLPPSSSPPRAVIVVLHGFIEHVARFEPVHTAFASQGGFAVFAFDQRGFGRTAMDQEHKSKDSKYGKTSWREQLADAEWAIKHAHEQWKGVPVFLMGHSMGGGLSLAFATRSDSPPASSSVSLLSGVIATSPLLLQTHPASKAARWLGGKVSVLAPAFTIPAEVKAEHLSHDKAIAEAYLEDPLVKMYGSLRGISDMLNGGEQLVWKDYERWPKNLPIFLVHGTADQVTSPKATETFYAALPSGVDKKLSLYEGGYHELQNEPDGVREKLINDCISWIDGHLSKGNENVSSKL